MLWDMLQIKYMFLMKMHYLYPKLRSSKLYWPFRSDDVRAVSDFCRELEHRCERAGETRLARRASTARRALDDGDVYANIKQQL